jgi:hypothetical protein
VNADGDLEVVASCRGRRYEYGKEKGRAWKYAALNKG